jgi:hypothetical protein
MTTAATDPRRFRINDPTVIAEVIGGEAVIVNLDSGTYFSLRDTAAIIWEQLERAETVDRIVRHVLERYTGTEEDISATIRTFVDGLVADGLIVPADAKATAVGDDEPAPAERTPFLPPLVERFTDMKDLLLLDPVHEADDAGWPRARATDES